ncbi:hypothetical protein AB0D40_31745 [Streptomyces massasporeus]|uniref:hypothetical protein n=1 Tax=Streptomyces massasporeus TaxID=67324 RepID=UPI0034031527
MRHLDLYALVKAVKPGEAPAGSVPSLLSRIAYADGTTVRLAVDELGDTVCALGFVVGEATAPTVPFLLELVGAPHVPCKEELMDLLASIYQAEQWHSAAAAARDQKNCTSYQEQPGWEAAARAVSTACFDPVQRGPGRCLREMG